MAWRQHAAIRAHGEDFPVDKTIGTPPFLVLKICRGWLVALEDRDGLGVVGMREHVDGRDLEQAIATVEELV